MNLAEEISRLIDEIGKSGVNEGTLRNRLFVIRDQAEALERQLADLQAQLRNPPPEFQTGRDLTQDAEKVLTWLFHRDDVPFEEIRALGFSPGIARHHCDILLERKMIEITTMGVTTDLGSSGPRFSLLPKGREYLVRHKLVS